MCFFASALLGQPIASRRLRSLSPSARNGRGTAVDALAHIRRCAFALVGIALIVGSTHVRISFIPIRL
jgi:hypothetical protein